MNQQFDEEISLTSLIRVVWKRKKFLVLSFITLSVLLIGFGSWKNQTDFQAEGWEYKSYLSIGLLATNTPIETPVAIETKVQEIYVPRLGSTYSVRFESNPTRMGNIVVLSTFTSEDGIDEEIHKLHRNILQPIVESHAKINSWTPTEILEIAKKNKLEKQSRINLKKFIVIGMISSLILSFVFVFILEFLENVRRELSKPV